MVLQKLRNEKLDLNYEYWAILKDTAFNYFFKYWHYNKINKNNNTCIFYQKQNYTNEKIAKIRDKKMLVHFRICAGIRRDDGTIWSKYLAPLIMAYILIGQSRETCTPILLKSLKQGGFGACYRNKAF